MLEARKESINPASMKNSNFKQTNSNMNEAIDFHSITEKMNSDENLIITLNYITEFMR